MQLARGNLKETMRIPSARQSIEKSQTHVHTKITISDSILVQTPTPWSALIELKSDLISPPGYTLADFKLDVENLIFSLKKTKCLINIDYRML